MAYKAQGRDRHMAAGEPPGVEMFGVLMLVLSTMNATGYKDVYLQKGRKKKPFQAKIYRPLRKDWINLGKFSGAQEAAVAVARQRLEGIEDCPSPDKSRAESSVLPRPALVLQCLLLLLAHLLLYDFRVRTEKRKLLAATPVNVPTPTTFQNFENRSVQLAVAQPQPWSAAASARAFAAGAVAVALAPALQ